MATAAFPKDCSSTLRQISMPTVAGVAAPLEKTTWIGMLLLLKMERIPQSLFPALLTNAGRSLRVLEAWIRQALLVQPPPPQSGLSSRSILIWICFFHEWKRKIIMEPTTM
jgi:hypothetical protein